MNEKWSNYSKTISAPVLSILYGPLSQAEGVSVALILPLALKHWPRSTWPPFEWLWSVICINRNKDCGMRGKKNMEAFLPHTSASGCSFWCYHFSSPAILSHDCSSMTLAQWTASSPAPSCLNMLPPTWLTLTEFQHSFGLLEPCLHIY